MALKHFASSCLLAFSAAAASQAAHAAEQPGPYLGLAGGANFLHDAMVVDNGKAIGNLSYAAGWLGALGAGYALRNGLRPELELGFRDNRVDGYEPSNVPASGNETATTVMGNLWYDLPLVNLPLRPYVGVGAGTARLDFRHFTNAHNTNRNDDDTVFAWQLGAGVAWDVSSRFALSLGYRYLHTNLGAFHLDPVTVKDISDAVLLGIRMNFGHQPEAAAAASPPPVAPEVATFETVVIRPVNFKFDRTEITPAASATLDEIAAELRVYPDLRVEIDGHTDSIGTDAYNMDLGLRRAKSVRAYLIKAGVEAERLSVKSFGESQPVETNKTRDGRAANRRAEFETSEVPANVKVVIEPPTPDSKKAAHGPEDPVPDQ